MLKKRSREMSGWCFLAFVLGLFAVSALPGFVYFYSFQEAQLHVAVIAGAVVGMFLLVAFDPIFAAVALICRGIRALISKRRQE